MAILVSQYDHCLADLLYRHRARELDCDIPLVLSNHGAAREIATTTASTLCTCPSRGMPKLAVEQQQIALLRRHECDLVVLARFMQILCASFSRGLSPPDSSTSTTRFCRPSSARGPYHQAFERGVKLIGATSHYVTEQMYGDRLVIANATGCSSIYGGNLPTTPYTTDPNGRGPAWSNSLFEDNAEYGLGFRFAIDNQNAIARHLLSGLAPKLGDSFVGELLDARQRDESSIAAQRERVAHLRTLLGSLDMAEARRLETVADFLVRKSVWVVGGDGWAYDIGYGGLDHVLSTGLDINILVLDTEVYSNTGGQMSKATPFGATAKFAMAGKTRPKKDLGLMAMTYGNVYVARAAFGAKDSQTVKVFDEAESYPGASLIIAYSHCIAHGYAMHLGLEQQRLAVESGTWPLFRFDPRRLAEDKAPLQMDSAAPKVRVKDYLRNELRFRMKPEAAPAFEEAAQKQVDDRVSLYNHLATIGAPHATNGDAAK